ncbi:unnamed protein product [Adineta steineri]|uniref:Uncharacterized protein n=1 Tax=Adineta steineri TaxID=433720 RepID=A0A815XQZ4_9BILA|nr:unnamed protein product [Adineta steineri]CAF1664669.1 unnamed protein product [Adineta steineri]
MDIYWSEFESAATDKYARQFIEENYRPKDDITISTLQTQINILQDENEQMRNETNEIKNRTTIGMKWMISAMKRVKMSRIDPPPEFRD